MSRLRVSGQVQRATTVERATQRDGQAIETWKNERWPELKKPSKRAEPSKSLNEARFYLLPMLVRTYAPVGQTPILRVPLTRDHLSAIGGIPPEGRIFLQMQEYAYRLEQVVEFLGMRFAQDPRETAGHLGWLPNPPFQRHQGISRAPRQPSGSIWNVFLVTPPS